MNAIHTHERIVQGCSMCNSPVYEVQGRSLKIVSRHHGEKHVTIIPIALILDKMGIRILE